MVYTYKNSKGKTYYLYGGNNILWFSPKKKKNCFERMPKGYTVVENPVTGMPLVKRVR